MHDFPTPEQIDCGEVTLAVHAAGSGPTVVLSHGFPELAYSWRFQIEPLIAAGYRVLAPDLRGYGGSDKPHGVGAYGIDKLIGDLTGLLDHFECQDAVFVGHDWGALLGWQMALLAPERMRAWAALNIPFAPRRDQDPMVLSRQLLGDDFYIVNFQDSDEADRAFDADPERFLRAMYRRLPATRVAFEKLPIDQRHAFSMLREMRKDVLPGTALFDDATLAVYVDAFRAGGFTPPINWYRNWSANWRRLEGVPQQVKVPTLFIGADDDVLIAPQHIETMRRYVDDLEVHVLKNCGHWTQQEQPEAVNQLLLDWLGRQP
ncbi:MAG: alpha/beta hydrolase [Pseudomonadota bacterium]